MEKKKFNYYNPYFEFENIVWNSSGYKKITGYNPKLLTQIYLFKVDFKKLEKEVNGNKYNIKIPFFVVKEW